VRHPRRAPTEPELIYIDLNHWVGLGKARLGQEDAGPYVDALAELRLAVGSARVVVPVSSTHYMEISRIASAQRRADLALTIGELSRYVALTPREKFLRHQFRRSLAQELRTGYWVPPPAVTGHGFAHAFGQHMKMELRGGDPASRERFAAESVDEFIPRLEEHTGFGWNFTASGHARTPLELFNEALDGSAQFRMLMGPADKNEPELLALGYKPSAAYDVIDAITRREADLAQQLANEPNWRQRLDDIIDARALYWDLREDWDQAVSDVWPRVVTIDEFGLERLRRILRGIPIVDIESSIRRANFSMGNHRWKKNDIHDSDFAGSAVTYCDVVWTEKHLQAQLRGQGLDRKYRTAVLSRPADLVAHLRRQTSG
jgi:hypothetical protein